MDTTPGRLRNRRRKNAEHCAFPLPDRYAPTAMCATRTRALQPARSDPVLKKEHHTNARLHQHAHRTFPNDTPPLLGIGPSFGRSRCRRFTGKPNSTERIEPTESNAKNPGDPERTETALQKNHYARTHSSNRIQRDTAITGHRPQRRVRDRPRLPRTPHAAITADCRAGSPPPRPLSPYPLWARPP